MIKSVASIFFTLLVVADVVAAVPQQHKAVRARAGATQQVIGSGTTVVAAGQSALSGDGCATKFASCMDAFCLSDNVNGGRCQCSADHARLSKELASIANTDRDSYIISTVGVEAAETGNVSVRGRASAKPSRVDLSMWANGGNAAKSTDDAVSGAALLRQSADICLEKIPECKSSEQYMRAKYSAQIKSDCIAFENAVKQQRAASQSRQNEAQRAVRSATYQRLQAANKNDLGGCVLEYKECMTTTAGCGNDFAGCVGKSMSAAAAKTYDITGANTTIAIETSTYDILASKKVICDSVLESCVNVKDQVWDAFLREAAPQLKTAELLAESGQRTACMSDISDCFVKACRDNIDANDPDGSYDMCLTRPESVKSFCKNEIEPCIKAEPLILDYVYARLAAMRVDSCTAELKNCLQDKDRCGSDYTQCVGLDTDTIIRMCPYDKLTGCQKVYGDTDIRGDRVYDELASMVQGVMLGVDNELLDFCQNAVDEAMIKVCGDSKGCGGLMIDRNLGAGSLEYKICEWSMDDAGAHIDYDKCRTDISQITDRELGRVPGSATGELGPVIPFMGVMDGIIFWESVTVGDGGQITGAQEYFATSGSTDVREEKKKQITEQLNQLRQQVDRAVALIEQDPTVHYCMTGRAVAGMKQAPSGGGRFPKITKQARNLIAAQALSVAKENYYKKYDALYERQMQDYIKIAERQAEIKGENAKDVRRELARISCVSLADVASLPMSPPPPGGWGAWLVAGVVAVAAIVAAPFTGGASLAGGAALVAAAVGGAAAAGASAAVLIATTVVTVAATAAALGAVVGGVTQLGVNAGDSWNESHNSMQLQLEGHHELNQWNWKQVIDTTFDWNTLNCQKCVRSTKCIKQSYPLFGMPKCKQWAESTETCTDTQF